MQLIVNSQCACHNYLSSGGDLLTVIPCAHLIHLDCVQKIKTSNGFCCPICNSPLITLLTKEDLKANLKIRPDYYQYYVDMMSIYPPKPITIDMYPSVLPWITEILDMLTDVMLVKSYEDTLMMNKKLLNYCGIKVKIKGKHRLTPETKVYVMNHCNNLDIVMLMSIINCGFLASSWTQRLLLARQVMQYYPVVYVKRGGKTKTLEKVKKFLKTQGRICIFPEGMLSHPKTLIQFRSGAFKTGYPVQPIVLQFPSDLWANSAPELLVKLLARGETSVTINVLDVERGHFDNQRIECVRQKMAQAGDLVLSRVSNRDVKD